MSNKTASSNKPSLVLLLGLSMTVGSLAIDMYLPALPDIARGLHADISLIQQTLSVFLFGFASCQLIYGPLSDSIGRKPVILVGLVIFACASLLCASAQTLQQLIWFRLLQSLGGGALTVMVLAVVRDLYKGNSAARAMSLVITTMTIVPLVAPSIGAQVLKLWNWRAIFLILALFAVALFAAVALLLPESLDYTGRQRFSLRTLLANYRTVLAHKQAVGNILCSGFAGASMFAFISGSPYLYIEYFELTPELYGLLFAVNITLYGFFSAVNANIVVRAGASRIIDVATKLAAITGALLLFFVFSGIGGVWSIAAAAAFLIGLSGPIAANAAPGATAPFAKAAGSASALLGCSRFLIGACSAALVGILHNETPLPMTGVMAVCVFISYCCNRWWGNLNINN